MEKSDLGSGINIPDPQHWLDGTACEIKFSCCEMKNKKWLFDNTK
jgi:hypothetical protein